MKRSTRSRKFQDDISTRRKGDFSYQRSQRRRWLVYLRVALDRAARSCGCRLRLLAGRFLLRDDDGDVVSVSFRRRYRVSWLAEPDARLARLIGQALANHPIPTF